MARPRLKRSIVTIEAPDGDLILMRTTGGDVRVQRPDPSERAILVALDGSRSLNELDECFGSSEVADTLAALDGMDLLEDAAEEDSLGAENESGMTANSATWPTSPRPAARRRRDVRRSWQRAGSPSSAPGGSAGGWRGSWHRSGWGSCGYWTATGSSSRI